MRTKDWQQIEDLFHATVAQDTSERSLYLRQQCSGNESLQREVESLINALESSNGLMEEPAFGLGMRVLQTNRTESMIGRVVGAYKITKQLGTGGMGEVYLAEDIRLGRKVALKFLSPEFIGDNWAKRQLKKEAQSVAMLDHPNICAIYGIEEVGEHSFIVMQYVEGETLEVSIRVNSLSAQQVLPLARQIVSALAEAHAHGIIHRDIKPKNIMVTPARQVKVLDFGLAKTIQKKSSATAVDSISHLSQAGLLAGTIAYMSPEQLRGERLDYRSDIFSLGTVLYEMLSGKNPHAHGTNADTISAILTRQPQPITQFATGLPRGFYRVIERCLHKDRDDRYQSASEMLVDLDNLWRVDPVRPRRSAYSALQWGALLAALLLLVAIATFSLFRPTKKSHTLAVLAITCEGIDSNTRCPGPSLTEELLRELSRRSDLGVKSSAMAPSFYGSQAASPQKLARDLGADVVLFGHIKQRAASLVLQTRLENVKDGSRIAEEEYTLKPEEMSFLEQELALKTSLYLQLPLTNEETSLLPLLAARQNRSPKAFELYLRGRSFWDKRDKDKIQKAIDYFKQATEVDPLYAQAWAGLADSYALLPTVAYGSVPTEDAMPMARAAARQALQIDPTLCEAHISMGVVKLKYEWNWPEAEKEFKRAIELNSDNASAHYWYSNLLAVTGRFDDAIAESKTARELDPFSRLVVMNLGRSYYRARDYDKALDYFKKILEENPDNISASYVLGYVYLQKGMYSEAIEIFEGISPKNKWLAAAPLGFAYAKAGRKADAQRILDEIEEQSQKNNPQEPKIPSQERAIVYIGLDNKDQAFFWLEKAFQERFAPIISLTSDPIFDGLRSDRRFADLARRINLKP